MGEQALALLGIGGAAGAAEHERERDRDEIEDVTATIRTAATARGHTHATIIVETTTGGMTVHEVASLKIPETDTCQRDISRTAIAETERVIMMEPWLPAIKATMDR